MNKTFLMISGGGISFILLIVVFWSIAQNEPAPKVASSSVQFIAELGKVTELDLDTVIIDPSSTNHALVVTLTNPSDQPVTIDSVTTSCGCTGATVNEKTIQPFSQGALNIKLSRASRGRRLFVITLQSKNMKTEVRLEGLVIVEHSWEPSSLGFVELKPHHSTIGQAIFNVIRTPDQNSNLITEKPGSYQSGLKILSFERASTLIKSDKYKVEQYKLNVEITPDRPGDFQSLIYILDTDSGKKYEYLVRWSVPKAVSVSPNQISFIGKNNQTRTCIVRTTNQQKLNLLNHSADSQWFKLAKTVQINEQTQKLFLEFLPEMVNNSTQLEGSLILTFENTKEFDIDVPVKWYK